MDPRRDYPKFTDAALEFFLRRFPSHPDHAAALAEVERRRQNRRDSAKPADEKATRVDSGVLIWAVGGILILALVLLFFLLPLAMAKTHSKRGPTRSSDRSGGSTRCGLSEAVTQSAPSPGTSRQAQRGQH